MGRKETEMDFERYNNQVIPLETMSGLHVESVEEFLNSPKALLTILDNIQEGIYLISPDLDLVYLNQAQRKWYHLDRISPGVKCYEAFHNREEPCVGCPAILSMRTGKPQYDLTRYEQNGMDLGVLKIYKTAITNSRGEVVLVLCYTQNLTSMISAVVDQVVYPGGSRAVRRAEHRELSPREQEVAQLIQKGYTSRQIAEMLVISKKAVDFHRSNIRRKLGLSRGENLRSCLTGKQ
jgi:DNA-binding CsgD family transcriptional regulator